MKEKIFLLLLALPLAVPGLAQTDGSAAQNIDFEEDTTQVVSLNDIIAMQNLVAEKNYRNTVIKDVWKYKKFFSFSYAGATMEGKNIWLYNPETGDAEQQKVKFTNDWGFALKRSRTFAFHKKPISDMVSFGLEFSAFDLSINHYSRKKDMPFDSRVTYGGPTHKA